MTVDGDMAPRAAFPTYPGRPRRSRLRGVVTERAGLILVVVAVAALAVIAIAAFVPLRSGTSRLLPPVPGGVTALPIGPPAATPVAPVPTTAVSPVPPPSGIPTGPAGAPGRGAGGGAAEVRPPASFPGVSIEAESAANTLGGDARIRTARNGSAGEAIGNLGGDPANVLRFNHVVVPATGTYALTIFYFSAERRSVLVRVDGGSGVLVTVTPLRDWDTLGSVTLQVRLDRGANSIELGNDDARAPDVDRITVNR